MFDFLVIDLPTSTVKTNKEELLLFLKQMYTMRRMEITNDNEYKVKTFLYYLFL
jgi:pyruvate dehydrogenase E1 component alpha subunit